MLSELKVAYDVVNEDMDFDNFKLLVVPHNIEITVAYFHVVIAVEKIVYLLKAFVFVILKNLIHIN